MNNSRNINDIETGQRIYINKTEWNDDFKCIVVLLIIAITLFVGSLLIWLLWLNDDARRVSGIIAVIGVLSVLVSFRYCRAVKIRQFQRN